MMVRDSYSKAFVLKSYSGCFPGMARKNPSTAIVSFPISPLPCFESYEHFSKRGLQCYK